jgi:hypothetical protein
VSQGSHFPETRRPPGKTELPTVTWTEVRASDEACEPTNRNSIVPRACNVAVAVGKSGIFGNCLSPFPILVDMVVHPSRSSSACLSKEDSFPKLLLSSLSDAPIDGVRLVMTARPHR